MRFVLPIGFFLALIASCAVPMTPTGGPVDQIPPDTVAVSPASGAVQIYPEEIEISFTEYVDAAAFQRAFSISPPFDAPLEPKWRGKTVRLALPEPLRENTTYVLSLDTEFKDLNNVALKRPLRWAFSTGTIINQGQILGRLTNPKTGAGLAQYDLFAYPLSDSLNPLSQRPLYRTQTDDAGQFELTYLPEDSFFVVATQDNNRNRQIDPHEVFAVPPQMALAATDSGAVRATWHLARRDTTAPTVQHIQPRSNQRLAVQFSEPVLLPDLNPARWVLTDSLHQQPVPIQAIYQSRENLDQIFVFSEEMQENTHRLQVGGVQDSSGNIVAEGAHFFQAMTAPDTLQARFAGFLPERPFETREMYHMLTPAMHPGLRLSRWMAADTLQKYLAVLDTSGTARPFSLQTTNGTDFLLDTPLSAGQTLVVQFREPARDTTYTRTYQRLQTRELGGLSGMVHSSLAGSIQVELFPEDAQSPLPPFIARADSTGTYVFDEVPAGTYRLRAFVDLNENQQWSGGQVWPFQPAEPLIWRTQSITIQKRFETVLEDTLSFAP